MFPIRWNFPFRKKNGALSTIGAEIENAGSYTLPTASSETKGGVKIGSGLAMEGEVLNNSNPTPYSLPNASSETLGGVKIGSRLTIAEGVLSADAQLPSSTSADENKVLTVGSDGTPEWATAGGGGGSLVYADFNVTFGITANTINMTNVQATAATGLVGKRLVSAMLPANLTGVTIIGAQSQHDPIQEDDWIQVWGAASGSPTTINKVRLWAQ